MSEKILNGDLNLNLRWIWTWIFFKGGLIYQHTLSFLLEFFYKKLITCGIVIKYITT